MEIMQAIVSYCICVFEVYMFYTFLQNFLPEREVRPWIRFCFLLADTVIVYSVNAFNNSMLNLIVNISLEFILAFSLFRAVALRKVLFTLLGCLILMFGEFAMAFAISFNKGLDTMKIGGDAYLETLVILMTKIISFIIFQIIKSFHNISKSGFAPAITVCFFSFPVATTIIYAGLLYRPEPLVTVTVYKIVILSGCIGLLVANILLFFVYEKLSWSLERIKEFEHFQAKSAMENVYYDKINEINNKYNAILHDLSHYLRTIGNLAVKNDDRKIVEILKSMQVNINNVNENIYCYNSIVNSILNDKKAKAETKQINFSISIDKGFNIENVNDYDLISMLSNLLDNAIEATEKVTEGERFIDVYMGFIANGGFILIKISNNFVEEPIKEDQFFKTIKDNKNKHGIGLKNVSDLAAKYGGFLDIKIVDHVFCASLTLSTYVSKIL